jgi:murein L,D-transpeptidase YcbB/YkuD
MFALFAAYIAASAGQARAGESVMEFWRHEWQRQANRAPEPIEQPYRDTRPYGGWPGGPAFGYRDWSLPQQQRRVAPARPMPTVHVDNPDFYTYTADRLQTVVFDKLCEPQIAKDQPAPPATSETTGSATYDSQPAPSAFTQACALSPAVSLRVLPLVGQALTTYYAAHPQFVWSTDGKISAKAIAVIAELAASDKFGLDPADYRVSVPDLAIADDTGRLKALLQFDLTLSAKALTYVLDATRGRVDPNRISGYHDLPRKTVDLVAALDQLATSGDAAAFLEARNPGNAQFRALVAELARLRSQEADPLLPIAEGTSIRPGESDPQLGAVITDIVRVASAELKQKFAGVLSDSAEPEVYTPKRVKLVQAFQKEKGLSPDGVIGKKTIRALTENRTAKAEQIAKIRFSLERLRWLPREFGSTYVFLNEPAFEVSYIQPGKAPLAMRAVVGRPDAQTYFFTDRIKDVQYNPYWNVPRSIVINEMLPKLYRDPSYLNDRGYEVSNQRGRQIASNSVDWAAFARDKVSVEVRQPPGRRNALGRVKIEFPNKHAIYMHDTPEKHLFTRANRAFSHGCVRLQHPREMAAAILGKSVDYVDKRIASGDTESERVTRDIPVYLAYFTAWPDAEGGVHYYDDVYSRDAHLQIAIAKTEAERAGQ